MALWSLKICHEAKVIAYIVDFHASFWDWSYIYSLLNQFITLRRGPSSKSDESSLLWSMWDDTGILVLSHVEISPFCWLASKLLLSSPLNLSSAMLLSQMCLIWCLTLVEKSFNTLEILQFWFLVLKPSGTRKSSHLTELWDRLWHVHLLLLQALSSHDTERLEENSGVGILAVAVTFWELMHPL